MVTSEAPIYFNIRKFDNWYWIIPANCIIKNFTPKFNNEGANLKSISLILGAIALYLPLNNIKLKEHDNNNGVAQSAMQRFIRFPSVVNVKIQIIIKEHNCCKKLCKDAQAGFWSASKTTSTVESMKFSEK